jgi:hypothetical protein
MVCHDSSSAARPSWVTLALKETQQEGQLMTMVVAATPLNRDDVTLV